MRLPLALALTIACAAVAPATFAQAPATAAAAGYSTKTSMIGDLMDNPDTKAVLMKYIPDVVNNPQIDQGRGYNLEGVKDYVPTLTPEMMAKIDADLAKVPMKK